MKKKPIIIYCLLLLITFCSCYDPEIEELYSYKDYVIEVTALFNSQKEGENFVYSIKTLQTNVFGRLVEENHGGYEGSIDNYQNPFNDKIYNSYAPPFSNTRMELVKGYKKVGVILTPNKNIEGFNIIISRVDIIGLELVNIDLELKDEIKFIYDFETDTYILE